MVQNNSNEDPTKNMNQSEIQQSQLNESNPYKALLEKINLRESQIQKTLNIMQKAEQKTKNFLNKSNEPTELEKLSDQLTKIYKHTHELAETDHNNSEALEELEEQKDKINNALYEELFNQKTLPEMREYLLDISKNTHNLQTPIDNNFFKKSMSIPEKITPEYISKKLQYLTTELNEGVIKIDEKNIQNIAYHKTINNLNTQIKRYNAQIERYDTQIERDDTSQYKNDTLKKINQKLKQYAKEQIQNLLKQKKQLKTNLINHYLNHLKNQGMPMIQTGKPIKDLMINMQILQSQQINESQINKSQNNPETTLLNTTTKLNKLLLETFLEARQNIPNPTTILFQHAIQYKNYINEKIDKKIDQIHIKCALKGSENHIVKLRIKNKIQEHAINDLEERNQQHINEKIQNDKQTKEDIEKIKANYQEEISNQETKIQEAKEEIQLKNQELDKLFNKNFQQQMDINELKRTNTNQANTIEELKDEIEKLEDKIEKSEDLNELQNNTINNFTEKSKQTEKMFNNKIESQQQEIYSLQNQIKEHDNIQKKYTVQTTNMNELHKDINELKYQLKTEQKASNENLTDIIREYEQKITKKDDENTLLKQQVQQLLAKLHNQTKQTTEQPQIQSIPTTTDTQNNHQNTQKTSPAQESQKVSIQEQQTFSYNYTPQKPKTSPVTSKNSTNKKSQNQKKNKLITNEENTLTAKELLASINKHTNKKLQKKQTFKLNQHKTNPKFRTQRSNLIPLKPKINNPIWK
ncbi:MAG: hypothetical protein AAFO15_01655 [Pseudomonadota bacterium]